jgi:hypothetical protein
VGKKSGASSKSKGPSAAVEPPTLLIPSGESSAAADGPGELRKLDARQRYREDLLNELRDEVSDTRAKAIAVAGKILNDYERAELRREEDELDQQMADELGKISRLKAATRSGVVREDEAPQLPPAGSPSTH